MEKEKTRGRTRRKQPSQVASFLYREGRRWFAAVLSLCLILNNMTGVTWAAQTAGEKEIWFKLTSSSLYEALQEAVRDGEKVNDHFLFEGKENDVEAYEKLLLLDDDLYELKPEFENKDEVEDAENKKNLQLRIFASLSWEIDPEKEYQVAGDEKIIFYLSNGSETEQTTVIQVDEKTTEDITVFSKSAVVIGSENKEESLEAETEEVAETRENEGGENETGESETGESETGESKGQAAEENSGEVVKKQGSGGNSGALSGGNGGNSENSPSGNDGNSGNSGSSTKTEISAEGGSFAGSSDEADKAEENKEDVEGEVQENPVEEAEKGQDNADNEEREDSKGSTDIQESIEHQGGEQDKAEDSNSAEKDKTNSNSPSESEKSEKPEEEGTEDKKTESVEIGNKEDKTSEKTEENKEPERIEEDKASEKIEEDKASEKIESEKTEDEKQENVITENTGDKKSEKLESSALGNADSKKSEKEKTDAENAVTGKSDQGKEESGKSETVKSDNTNKQDRTDKEPSKMETSGKNASENTKADKEEKTGTGKSEKDNSGISDTGSSDNSKTDKSNHSDSSSDNGKEISVGISRNAVLLVTDNLEESESHNLEASETKDADTVDDDSTAATASPSNAEDDEIEGELYEPVVMDEETVIVFVTTAEELGLNYAELRKASPSDAERISPAFEKEVELENVIVQVKADENVLPEGVQLQVKELKEEGEHAAQYEEAKEALDSQGTEYDGMMALDISFLDNKGREIEPDGNVQVSIKVKKEALPEEADLESITVQHLAEEEGEVFVEEVADCGDKTKGKVEVEAEEHVEAAFEVDSFSVFTVTWTVGDNAVVGSFEPKFYYLEDGRETEFKPTISLEDLTITDENVSNGVWEFPLNEKFSTVQGYLLDHVEFTTEPYRYAVSEGKYSAVIGDAGLVKGDSVSGTVNAIRVRKVNGGNGISINYLVEIDKKGETNSIICPGGFGGSIAEIYLKVYFRKAGVEITETIAENGQLTASAELEAGQSYVWYKWKGGPQCPTVTKENGEQIRDPQYQVSKRLVTGDIWNIEQEGKVLNAVYDGGANYYYLVAVKDSNGNEIMESSPFLMDYSDQIVNGSFEFPLVLSATGGNHYYEFFEDDTLGLVWKSTTAQVELVNEKSMGNGTGDQHGLNGENTLPDGKQCAELNPKTEGALYQDVLTMPEATLHWSLWHRARVFGEDTMYVVIMSKDDAEKKLHNGVTQTELRNMIDDIKANPQNYPDSTRVWELTSRQQWTFHTDDYVVGKGQFFTRFFFVAGKTASGNSSVGNLLDDIRFGMKVPPVVEQKGGISITKLVSGLSAKEMDGYELTIRLKKVGDESDNVREIKFNKFTLVNGGYSEAGNIMDLIPGEYIIEEIITSTDDNVNKREPKVSMKKNNVEEVPVILSEENPPQAKITINQGEVISLQITNAYEKLANSFVLKKTFENGKEKEFSPDETNFSNVQFGLYLADAQWKIDSQTPVRIGTIQIDESENEDKDVIGIIEFTSLSAGHYLLHEEAPPTGYKVAEDRKILVGEVEGKFGVYLYDKEQTQYICVSDKDASVDIVNIEDEKVPEIPSGAILPDTGGPGLAMFERYGWFLLMLALLMAGVEVRCYGERKYRRASVTQNEEFDAPL